jgi:hypothetical protein
MRIGDIFVDGKLKVLSIVRYRTLVRVRCLYTSDDRS